MVAENWDLTDPAIMLTPFHEGKKVAHQSRSDLKPKFKRILW